MSKHSDRVNAEYSILHPTNSDTQRAKDIGERCRIARTLWKEISADAREGYLVEAKLLYNQQLEEYRLLRDSLTQAKAPTRESQERCAGSSSL